MNGAVDMALRERVASQVLGQPVREGDMMACRFASLHTHRSGPRDLRVCLAPGKAGELPTFYCFHSSCREAWAPLNKELRRGIWFGEHGRDPDKASAWSSGVAAAPTKFQKTRQKYHPTALQAVQREDWRTSDEWFAERSPVDVGTVDAVEFLRLLYRPGERVLIFTKFNSQGQFLFWHGQRRETFRLADEPGIQAVPSKLPKGSPDGVWYLCAPVTGKWESNPRVLDEFGNPKLSRRSQETVTAWRYLVLESDVADPALWRNLLAQLPLPIAAIYTSGGKSIHALVKVDADSKEAWDRFKQVITPLLTKLGADGAAISAVRLTRLPGCMRGNRLQKLLYLNPNPDPTGVPIGEMGGVLCG